MKYTKLNYFVSQSSQQKESGPAEIRVEKKDATTRMKEKVVAGVDGGPRRFEPKTRKLEAALDSRSLETTSFEFNNLRFFAAYTTGTQS